MHYNGPQFSNAEYKEFGIKGKFNHAVCHRRANALAEKIFPIAKKVFPRWRRSALNPTELY